MERVTVRVDFGDEVSWAEHIPVKNPDEPDVLPELAAKADRARQRRRL